MTTNNTVTLGSRWRGFSGNIMEVYEIDGDRVKLAYVDDPGDFTWETIDDVVDAFARVK